MGKKTDVCSATETDLQEDTETQSLEEQFEQLNVLIARLEDSSVSLEESFRAYEEGMRLLKSCNDKIDRVEKRVLMLNSEGGLDEF